MRALMLSLLTTSSSVMHTRPHHRLFFRLTTLHTATTASTMTSQEAEAAVSAPLASFKNSSKSRRICAREVANAQATGSAFVVSTHVEAFDPNHVQQQGWKINAFDAPHQVISDQAQAKGGNDLGPTPKELLLSSLASCTLMTLRTFVDNSMKQQGGGAWALLGVKRLSVFVDEEMGQEDAHVPTAITMEILVETHKEASEAQVKRLLQVANVCPVKKMLRGDINIRTTILLQEEAVVK